MVASSQQQGGLSVIALVSGGKDSFFSILHCLANGHRVVALANLHPASPSPREEPSLAGGGVSSSPAAATATTQEGQTTIPADGAAVTVLLPGHQHRTQGHGHGRCHGHTHTNNQGPRLGGQQPAAGPLASATAAAQDATTHQAKEEEKEEQDLNSFMYQTVGHQVIPLYAEATGIPLYRRAIVGGAGRHGKDYSHHGSNTLATNGDSRPMETDHEDETESMVPLLRAIQAAHPEADAVCAGAILSTYQRTRVESVAVRLGLVPLAYLWKFPVLPVLGSVDLPDAQLLDDMAAVGLEARIIKVASGGLDDDFLWTNVASAEGKNRIARAMRRFGTAETGAVIGEGGEFETLVLDGPRELFKKRIVVDEEGRRVVREGGGTAWLSFGDAHVEDKDGEGQSESEKAGQVRTPELLDPRLASVLDTLSVSDDVDGALDGDQPLDQSASTLQQDLVQLGSRQPPSHTALQQWFFASEPSRRSAVVAETESIVSQIRHRLQLSNLSPSAIISSTIVLRRMGDFPAINAVYGALFDAPNPPSRVTISCGDSLAPADAHITVALAVHTHLQPGQRQGLHVQSRSYWAPANIGPYSQAIAVPLASLAVASSTPDSAMANGNGPKLISIAGQIPLVPSTMSLPPAPPAGGCGSSESMKFQLALSLQHLWRIGLEMNVKWWTSGVVYFPRQSGSDSSSSLLSYEQHMSKSAQLACKAWQEAHLWTGKQHRRTTDGDDDHNDDEDDDEDEDSQDENGPDLWDRKFNPAYMSFAVSGGGSGKPEEQKLPDWSVVDEAASRVAAAGGKKSDKKKKKKERRAAMLPPLFVAEVEELPRGAGAEWHAHLGVAGGGEGGVVVLKEERRGGGMSVSQTVIRSEEVGGGEGGVALVQTVVAERVIDHPGVLSSGLSSLQVSDPSSEKRVFKEQDQLAREAVTRWASKSSSLQGLDDEKWGGGPAVAMRYVDAELYGSDDAQMGIPGSVPIVPCRSLWDGQTGGRLASVTVYQSVFET